MNSSKNIHQGHRERLRSRFINYGADSLCEHELLELILFYALPRVNTNDTAHLLLKRFGSINGILNASPDELMQVSGIGPAAAAFLRLLSDICNEYSFLQSEPPPLNSQEELSEYFCEYFNDGVAGLCLLVTLTDRLDITDRISFTSDSVVSEKLDMRRIAELLIRSGCRKTAIGIHHPGRLPIPDQTDYFIAQLFASKFAPMDIHLTDCIVCSGKQFFSMKENGAFSFY